MLSVKKFGLVVLVAALFAAALPATAQDATQAPVVPPVPALGTITVYGSATVEGTPDHATLELGVDTFTASVQDAFAESNETIRAITDAIIALGVAQEDIQTANLSVYATSRYLPDMMGDQPGYQVSNTVRVKVRDIDLVDDIINAGIGNGATSLYGLYFSVENAAPLETMARQEAVAQAQARAAELAGLVGATVGEVVAVSEDAGGYPVIFSAMDSTRAQSGGGGAYVAPGLTSVTVGVTVTFQLVK